ncbi:MAG: hypothetical protein ACI88G_001718 [Woeseiaceae bacterium]|jgi:hypothetical protein
MVDLIEAAFLEGQIDGGEGRSSLLLVDESAFDSRLTTLKFQPENGFVPNLSHEILKEIQRDTKAGKVSY